MPPPRLVGGRRRLTRWGGNPGKKREDGGVARGCGDAEETLLGEDLGEGLSLAGMELALVVGKGERV